MRLFKMIFAILVMMFGSALDSMPVLAQSSDATIYAIAFCIYSAGPQQPPTCNVQNLPPLSSLAECNQAKAHMAPVGGFNVPVKWECLKKTVPAWQQTGSVNTPQSAASPPTPPDAFAWRMGEQPPPGVTPDKDGMPEGYEIQSGASHDCRAPECLWFVREKPMPVKPVRPAENLSQALPQAGDPRCNAPPYGGTVAEFQAFVKNLGSIVTPTEFLPKICNMRYGGAPRTGLYNLGFTDEQIDAKDTVNLAVDVLPALKNLADKTVK